jgi:hypothetical protein
LFLGGVGWYFRDQILMALNIAPISNTSIPSVTNFDDCVKAGNPVLESYPAQCKTKSGQTFTENIGNELELTDLIQITKPRPNEVASSPIIITGQARGNWFFEGQFTAKLVDDRGQILNQTVIKSLADWTTTDFVPFAGELVFRLPSVKTGKLLLVKDNPSGIPENERQLEVPLKFTVNQ